MVYNRVVTGNYFRIEMFYIHVSKYSTRNQVLKPVNVKQVVAYFRSGPQKNYWRWNLAFVAVLIPYSSE